MPYDDGGKACKARESAREHRELRADECSHHTRFD